MAPRSLARLALLALLWGSSFLWIKLALDGLSPVQLVLVRLALGAAVLVLVVRVRWLRLPRDRATWLRLTVAALIGNAIPYLLFAIGEQTVSSSLAGALNATTPLWTLGIGLAARTERQVTPLRVVGLLVGFAGVLAPWNAPGHGAVVGALACLGAAASTDSATSTWVAGSPAVDCRPWCCRQPSSPQPPGCFCSSCRSPACNQSG
jgi:drug/metabolite transporter (DMT)-like permease